MPSSELTEPELSAVIHTLDWMAKKIKSQGKDVPTVESALVKLRGLATPTVEVTRLAWFDVAELEVLSTALGEAPGWPEEDPHHGHQTALCAEVDAEWMARKR